MTWGRLVVICTCVWVVVGVPVLFENSIVCHVFFVVVPLTVAVVVMVGWSCRVVGSHPSR